MAACCARIFSVVLPLDDSDLRAVCMARTMCEFRMLCASNKLQLRFQDLSFCSDPSVRYTNSNPKFFFFFFKSETGSRQGRFAALPLSFSLLCFLLTASCPRFSSLSFSPHPFSTRASRFTSLSSSSPSSSCPVCCAMSFSS